MILTYFLSFFDIMIEHILVNIDPIAAEDQTLSNLL